MPNIFIFIHGIRMLFGVAGAADADAGALLFDLFDQLDRMLIVSGAGKIHSLRNIASERENIFDPGIPDPADLTADTVSGGTDAGEVCHGSDPFLHDVLCDLNRILTGSAARAVSAADKSGVQPGYLNDSLSYGFKSGVRLWRKDLHGYSYRVLP